jgi:SnoaL-like domain
MSEAKNTALGGRTAKGYSGRMPTPSMKSSMLNLPGAVRRYLAAANRHDADAVAACFTADASVRDENRLHVGQEAIRAWLAEVSRKYRPILTVVGASGIKNDVQLAVAICGQFPGSPVTLDFEFRLRGGQIAGLSIE